MKRLSLWVSITFVSGLAPCPSYSQTFAETPRALSYVETIPPWLVMAGPSTMWNKFFDASRPRPDSFLDPRSTQQGSSVRKKPKSTTLSRKASEDQRWPALIIPPPRTSRVYKRTFRSLLNHPEKTDRYDLIISKYADQFGLDPRLLKAIIAAESEFMVSALSPKGAVGLMQVMPATAEEVGVSKDYLWNPEANIKAGAAYLSELFRIAWRRFKLKGVSYKKAPPWLVQRIIASYNAGPRFLWRGGYYRQTLNYVKKVLLFHQSEVADIRRRGFLPSIPPFSLVPAAGYLH